MGFEQWGHPLWWQEKRFHFCSSPREKTAHSGAKQGGTKCYSFHSGSFTKELTVYSLHWTLITRILQQSLSFTAPLIVFEKRQNLQLHLKTQLQHNLKSIQYLPATVTNTNEALVLTPSIYNAYLWKPEVFFLSLCFLWTHSVLSFPNTQFAPFIFHLWIIALTGTLPKASLKLLR